MITQADTHCQFVRQVPIATSKSHCHEEIITIGWYQLAVGTKTVQNDQERLVT